MYTQLSDEVLINMYNDGDEEAVNTLIRRYLNMVAKKATSLFIIGGDKDDLIQEGLIGFLEAINDYDEAKGKFASFASLCINRQMLTAINMSNAKKNTPLNQYLSIDASRENPDYEGSGYRDYIEVAVDANPETLLIQKEDRDSFQEKLLDMLSTFERTVYEYYMDGLTYREIADILGKSSKSVDNALNRIKAKALTIMNI